MTVPCPWCGRPMTRSQSHRKYCRRACRMAAEGAQRRARRQAPRTAPVSERPYWARVDGDRYLGQQCGHRHNSEEAAEKCKACKFGHVEYFEP